MSIFRVWRCIFQCTKNEYFGRPISAFLFRERVKLLARWPSLRVTEFQSKSLSTSLTFGSTLTVRTYSITLSLCTQSHSERPSDLQTIHNVDAVNPFANHHDDALHQFPVGMHWLSPSDRSSVVIEFDGNAVKSLALKERVWRDWDCEFVLKRRGLLGRTSRWHTVLSSLFGLTLFLWYSAGSLTHKLSAANVLYLCQQRHEYNRNHIVMVHLWKGRMGNVLGNNKTLKQWQMSIDLDSLHSVLLLAARSESQNCWKLAKGSVNWRWPKQMQKGRQTEKESKAINPWMFVVLCTLSAYKWHAVVSACCLK